MSNTFRHKYALQLTFYINFKIDVKVAQVFVSKIWKGFWILIHIWNFKWFQGLHGNDPRWYCRAKILGSKRTKRNVFPFLNITCCNHKNVHTNTVSPLYTSLNLKTNHSNHSWWPFQRCDRKPCLPVQYRLVELADHQQRKQLRAQSPYVYKAHTQVRYHSLFGLLVSV